jgi:hypothetical protein
MNPTILALRLSITGLGRSLGHAGYAVLRWTGLGLTPIAAAIVGLVFFLTVALTACLSCLEIVALVSHFRILKSVGLLWSQHPVWMGLGHLLVWTSVVAVGWKKGAFGNHLLWVDWPAVPNSHGKETHLLVAIAWWALLAAASGPLVVILGLYWFITWSLRTLKNSPAGLRARRDAILDANPEARARLERTHLDQLLKDNPTSSRPRTRL